MSDSTDIVPLVREAAEVVNGQRLEGLSLDSEFADLALDSMSVMEIIGVVEKRLSIRFNDSDLAHLVTLRDLSNLVEKKRGLR